MLLKEGGDFLLLENNGRILFENEEDPIFNEFIFINTPLDYTFSGFIDNSEYSLQLPLLDFQTQGVVGGVGEIVSGIPLLKFHFESQIILPNSIIIELSKLDYNLTGTSGSKSNLNYIFDELDFLFQGTSGIVGTIEYTIPSSEINSNAYQDINATLQYELPSLNLIITSENILTLPFQSFALCTDNLAITEYTNFDFITLGKFDGEFLGVKADGIYLLDGDDDEGVQIDSKIITRPSSNQVDFLKRNSDVYLHGDLEKDGMLLIFEDQSQNKYIESQLVRSKNNNEIYRAKIPRGIKSRSFSIGFKNKNGTQFEVDAIEIVTNIINRKVK